MNHINSMSKLREQVAFEGYAQKNPLVVYKEKAFGKFRDLIDEIEFKVVKALFSLNVDTIIEQKKIREEELQLSEVNLENIVNQFEDAAQESQRNPLFVAPGSQNQNTQKTKIRV